MEPGADVSAIQDNAAEAARLLRLLANERRLLLLCHLVGAGEMTVTALAASVGLSQPALSQHLAKLRADGLVATRKSSQTVFYRLADPKAARLLEVLRDLYCPPQAPAIAAEAEATNA
ncbi:metalloregulator ArsR/SmtB family transcription factor [Sediminicoccus sp. KRV36]|uniref:ArsR/SmtB family transcription factor n=1 Tax=Sediminicoccus sp. KRV36 TaxID=3133721 RepID=UPI00200E9BFD|nr:metalloregulator ArsR/SmtB family transcription factor [Sediminicoccus rosea]UPY35589.1 metalloregulator ArsR/SmtB family transcription factor [Sediminicoccus rosea]